MGERRKGEKPTCDGEARSAVRRGGKRDWSVEEQKEERWDKELLT